MGQNSSIALARDTVVGEQYLEQEAAEHNVVHKAFQKCIVQKLSSSSETKDNEQNELVENKFEFSKDERSCVEEYALLYAAFLKKASFHFTSLYDQHQQDLLLKAQMEYRRQQARSNLQQEEHEHYM